MMNTQNSNIFYHLIAFLTVMEHHSNIVPWQLIRNHAQVSIKVVPIDAEGRLQLDVYKSLFSETTRMVAIAHVSNVLGTVNPVKEMIAIAHSHGVPLDKTVIIMGARRLDEDNKGFPVSVKACLIFSRPRLARYSCETVCG